MTTRKLAALISVLVLAIFGIACGGGNDNTGNTNRANANNTNANTTANVNTNANANTTANANTNANRAPTKEDVEKNKETYNTEAKNAGRKVGSGASDTWLWVKTKYDLAAANDLRDSTINVDVENGVVTLTGTVASQDQVKKADQIAKSVSDVKGVKNMLKVSASGNSNNANKNANTTANTNAKH